jgi:HAD superfamily hydrolase (TIGR01484 family)
MKSIAEMPAEEAKGLQGLLFDLDDTLLTHGHLTEAAYGALFRLQECGLRLFCVTGRPITWGKLLVGQWPIEAAVCETGPLSALLKDGRLVVQDTLSPAAREHNRARLRALVDELHRRFQELLDASDATERVSDFTFDIGETRNSSPQMLQAAIDFAEAQGARTNRSSVHMHVTFDAHDKASGVLDLLHREFAYDPTLARKLFAYIGDSENDAACFAAFTTSIGVENLRGTHTLPPKYKTRGARGAGFVEAAQHLVTLRHG